MDISPLTIDPPIQSSLSLEHSYNNSFLSREHHREAVGSSLSSIAEKKKISTRSLSRSGEIPSTSRAALVTMNLDQPCSILCHSRGDGGGGSGVVSSRSARHASHGGPNLNSSSSNIMTNRPTSRSNSRGVSSNVTNNLQQQQITSNNNRSSNQHTGVSPRKLSRTLSGSGHLARNLSCSSNIPSLSGNISSNLSSNLGGNLSGNLGGGNLSNTSTAGSGDEELDLDELLRLNIPHSRRNVDRSVEELCGGREGYGTLGRCGVGGGVEQNKLNKVDNINTIAGRITPLTDSSSANPYKTCNLVNSSSKSNLAHNNNPYSSKTNINRSIYSSNTNIHSNPYASNSNINVSSYASNPNISHDNPYASNISISNGTGRKGTNNGTSNPYSTSIIADAGSGKSGQTSGRSAGSRRGILQRSDTAPEELLLERKIERKMESDWRRKRNSFIRASSAERPSSVTHNKTPAHFHTSLSSHPDYAG